MPAGSALGIYNVATGEIYVVVNDVVNWYIQSTSAGLTGVPVGDLPGPGLVTDNNSRIGETGLVRVSYSVRLGAVAAPRLPIDDLTIYWNSTLGSPLQSGDVDVVGTVRPAAPLHVEASDSNAQLVRVTWESVAGVTDYEVWRGDTSEFVSARRLARTNHQVYFDTSAASGQTYRYWVLSRTVSGISEPGANDEGGRPSPNAAADAFAYYAMETGEITVTVRNVINWYVQSSTSGLTGAEPVGLPGANGLISNNNARIGETSLERFTYESLAIGAVAAPNLPFADLVLYFNTSLGGAQMSTRVIYVSNQTDVTGLAAPTGVAASDGRDDQQIVVTWNAVPSANSYSIWRSPANDPSAAELIGGATSNSFVDRIVQPGRVYYYWVTAHNPLVASGLSAPDTGRPEPAVVPRNVNASDGTVTDRVNITWAPLASARRYEVWRSITDDLTTAVLIGRTESTRFDDTGAAINQRYYYWIRAELPLELSGFSESNRGHHGAVVGEQVAATYDLATGRIDVTVSNVVNWYIRSSSGGLTGADPVGLPGAGGLLTNNNARIGETSLANFSYMVSLGHVAQPGLPEGDLVVYYNDDLGTPLTIGLVEYIDTPNGTPRTITASDNLFEDRVRINWSAVEGALSYQVWRGETVDPNAATRLADGLTEREYDDTFPLAGRTYYYWVRVLSDSGLSPFSRSDAGSVLTIVSPSSVRATDGDSIDYVDVEWSTVAGARSYQVWRSETENSADAMLLAEGITVRTYRDRAAEYGQIYRYWVRTQGEFRLSPFGPSDLGHVLILESPVQVATDGTFTDFVRISWPTVRGADSYQIWRSETADSASAILLAQEIVSLEYEDTTANFDTTYYYWVRSVGNGHVSSFGNPDAGFLRRFPEITPTVTKGFPIDRIVVTWNAARDATSYEVWRATNQDLASASRIAEGITETRYDDHDIVAGQRYSYWVRAVGPRGAGPFGDSELGFASIVSDQARATYHVTTGEIVVTVDDVVNWYIESASASLRGVVPTLPAGGGLATASTRRVGETSLNNFSYANLNLGQAALPDLPAEDLRLVFNDDLGMPSAVGVIVSVGQASPRIVQATDREFEDLIRVEWSEVAGVDSYQVWRSRSSDNNTAVLVADGLTSLTYDDRDVPDGQIYYYWVRVLSPAGTSILGRHDAGALRTIASPSSVTATDSRFYDRIVVNWTPVNGARSYQVWRSDIEDHLSATLVAGGLTTLEYSDSTAQYDKTYYYWVRAQGSSRTSPFGVFDTGSLRSLVPVSPEASQGLFTDKVEIRWIGVVGATSFEVWRGPDSHLAGAERIADSILVTQFDDQSAIPGQSYFYWVRAIGPAGAGPFGISKLGYASILSDQARATYHVTTGEIVVTVDDVVNWYIESASASLRGVVPALPAGGGLATASIRRLGESSLNNFSYTNLSLGQAALPDLPAEDLRLVFNDELGVLSAVGVIVSVGQASPRIVQATDREFEDLIRVEWSEVAGVDSYQVWRSRSSDNSTAVLVADGLTSLTYDDRDIPDGQIYYYWVRVLSPAGASILGRHDAGALRTIASPSSVTATDRRFYDRIVVNWTPVNGAQSYQVWRSDIEDQLSATLVAGGLTTLEYSDSTAQYDKTYYYWVRAQGSSRTSPFGAFDTGSLRSLVPVSPEATQGLFTDKVEVRWNRVLGATSFEVWRGPDSHLAGAERIADSILVTQYDDRSAIPGQRYFYWVRAIGPGGAGPFGDSELGFASIVSDQVTATYDIGSGEIVVTVTDVVNWYVESKSSSLTGVTTALPAAGGLRTASARRFGESALVNFSYAAVNLGQVAPPELPPDDLRLHFNDELGTPTAIGVIQYVGQASPRTVMASDGTFNDRVRIEWSSVAGAISYQVWRSTSNDRSTATLLVEGVTDQHYDDRDAAVGQTYYYWVRVLSAQGISALSRSDAGSTFVIDSPATVQAHNFPDRIEINWTAVQQASAYQVWRSESSDPLTAIRLAEVSGVLAYTDRTAAFGVTYYYWIRAQGAGQLSSFSQSVTGAIGMLFGPRNVQASDGTFADLVRITWSAVDGATSYEIFRREGNISVLHDSAASSPYDDRTVEPGISHYYWVRARIGDRVSDFGLGDLGFAGRQTRLVAQASDGSFADRVEVRWQATGGVYEVWRSNNIDRGSAERIAPTVFDPVYRDFSALPGQRYYYWVRVINGPNPGPFSDADVGYIRIEPNQASALHIVDTGEIVVTVSNVVNWYIQSANSQLIPSRLQSLPAASGLLTNSARYVGETRLDDFSYADVSLGFIAPPDLSPTDLTLYFNDGLGLPLTAGVITVLNSATPRSVQASDFEYADRVAIRWQGSSQVDTTYEVHRSTTPNLADARRIVDGLTAMTYDDTNVVRGQVYYYWVRGITSGANSSFSIPDTGGAESVPAPPSQVQASDGTSRSIQISWSAVDGAAHYSVWRHTANDSAAAHQVATGITNLNWHDTDGSLVRGQPYYYWVMASNLAGNSPLGGPDTGYSEDGLVQAPVGEVRAIYVVATGEIQVGANDVVNWYIQSTSQGLIAQPGLDLPGPGLVTTSRTRIGETALGKFSYSINLGIVANIGLPQGDLTIYFNTDLGRPLQSVPVSYIAPLGLASAASDAPGVDPRRAAASADAVWETWPIDRTPSLFSAKRRTRIK